MRIRQRFSRRALVAAISLVASMVWSVSTNAQVASDTPPPQVCEQPAVVKTLYAKNMRNGRIGYGLTEGRASIPGPTLEMTEGECMQVTLVNNADRRLSMHSHGVAYTVASDGTPLNGGCVRPGASKTYLFEATAPATREDGTVDPGTAGYWHYHDHCMGTPHGTEGVARGLYGALVVRRAGDPLPDRQVVLAMNNISFNNKLAPRTPMPEVNLGERVEFIVIAHGELFHTFHLHGHRWADNRTGLIASTSDPTRLIDNKTAGPADSFGFQVVAGEHVGPGAWMYHCHVQGHSDAGMEGLFVVKTAGGTLTAEAQAAIDSFRSGAHSH